MCERSVGLDRNAKTSCLVRMHCPSTVTQLLKRLKGVLGELRGLMQLVWTTHRVNDPGGDVPLSG
jgi:hypothetical protein